MNLRPRALCLACIGLYLLAFPLSSEGQVSKSATLARELAQLMDQAKLDSIAAKDPEAPDGFVAALYFAGSQLLVVSARYLVPIYLTDKLASKSYRDIYIDLNSASIPESKIFIEDLGADGLKAKREENQPYDTYENNTLKRFAFDGDWKKHKMSEDDYLKTFTTADERYTQILTALLAQLKKTS